MQPPSSPLRPSDCRDVEEYLLGYSSTAFSSAFASHGGFAFTSTHHKQRCHRVDRGAVPLAQARSCVRSGNGGGQGALPRSPHEPPHAATGCSASTRGDSSAGAARSDAAKFSPPHHGQRRAAPPGNGQRRPPRAPLPALWRPLPAAPRSAPRGIGAGGGAALRSRLSARCPERRSPAAPFGGPSLWAARCYGRAPLSRCKPLHGAVTRSSRSLMPSLFTGSSLALTEESTRTAVLGKTTGALLSNVSTAASPYLRAVPLTPLESAAFSPLRLPSSQTFLSERCARGPRFT